MLEVHAVHSDAPAGECCIYHVCYVCVGSVGSADVLVQDMGTFFTVAAINIVCRDILVAR